MANYKIDNDALLSLADSWKKLPEGLRKQIFKEVYRKDDKFIRIIADQITGGFTPKKIVLRPSPIVAQIDRLLIDVAHGKELRRIVKEYFTEYNKRINDSFIRNFSLLAEKSPELTNKQITEIVLANLHSEFKDDPLLKLYETALPVCEPVRYSDSKPDLKEFYDDDGTTSDTSDNILDLQNVSDDQDQHHDYSKRFFIDNHNHKPSTNNVQGPHKSQITIGSLPKSDNKNIQTNKLSGVVEEVAQQLRAMPIAEAEKIIQLCQRTISSLNREYKEYSTRLDELDKHLTELRGLGLISDGLSNEAFFITFHHLPISEATDKQLQGISQATAILAKYKRLIELEGILNNTIGNKLYGLDKPDLGELLSLIDINLSELEKLFNDQVKSESLLSEFAARLETCDYSTARQFVAEMTPEGWEDLVRSTITFGNFSKSLEDKKTPTKQSALIARSILMDPMMIGLILSVAWQANSITAIKILHLLMGKCNPPDVRVLGFALSGLTFEQLKVVSAESPHLAREIIRLTLLSIHAYQNPDAIHWLQTLASYPTDASSAEVEFIKQCAISQERGCLIQDLSVVFNLGTEMPFPDSHKNDIFKELNNLIDVHGLGGNYRKLRELARERYIMPVMLLVKRHKTDDALKLWDSYGDYENMVHIIKDAETLHNLERKHLNKTIQHLKTFDKVLKDWAALSISKPGYCPNDSFKVAFNDFIKVSGASEKVFQNALHSILTSKGSDVLPPVHFGRIAIAEGHVSKAYINPVYIENWIMACNSQDEETSGIDLLAESLTHMFGKAGMTSSPRDILDILMTKSQYTAAKHLVNLYPDLDKVFQEKIAEVRKTILKEYENEWSEAQSIAPDDDNVQMWLMEIERLMDKYNFKDVHNYLPDLKEAIQEYKTKYGDEYKAGVTFLREAGRNVSEKLSFNELQKEVELLKEESILKRQHISCLENVLVSSSYEDTFKKEVKTLLDDIDHPVRWLPPDQSKIISEELLIILKYLETRFRWRDAKPDIYHKLSISLAKFITKTVEVLSNPQVNYMQNNELTDLAVGIELESWEADDIIKYLDGKVRSGELPEARAELPNLSLPDYKPPDIIIRPPEILVAREKPPQVNDDIIKEKINILTRTIFGIAKQETKITLPKEVHAILRANCQGRKWHEARVLAANILLQDKIEDKFRKLVKAIYCITLTYDSVKPKLTSDELIAVCLGTIMPMLISEHEHPFYYTERDNVIGSVVRSFLQGLTHKYNSNMSNTEIKTELASSLSALLEGPASDASYRWLMELLHEASVLFLPGSQKSAAKMLITILWEQLTGVIDPAKSRSKLLLLCFRLNHIDDIITSLAKDNATPYDYYIIQFLRAVRSSEANVTAWDEARRLAQSFIEQVPANKLKPWRIMVDTLNRSRKNESYQERCTISLENCSRQDDKTFLLEICVSPGPYSILESALLYIGDDTSNNIMQINAFDLTDQGDQIARAQIKRIKVSLDPSLELDHVVVFPYRLVAKTTSGNDIDQRDRWTVNLRQTDQPRLPVHVLLNLWKGADGNPVDSSLNAYHGREEESKKIEQLLAGNDGRQRSALIIGQRRIGKTSLLIETLRRYPPRQGHVCAVYTQFGGIQKRKPTESLSETVFNALTEIAADVGGYNKEFCNLLSDNLGNTWLRDLRKGLNPATSIQAALTTFVNRVTSETKGRIERMAFFVDEFQAIFKYPTEVDQVMWGLRPLVQMSSTISLIFAGSGLTRGLIRNYDKAFFGSIATIDLKPFSIENDYQAIADTLLPEEARQFLCPNSDNLKGIVQEAYHLTGGHPWYLSMLGRSAATQLQGRILTPILLKDVARKMVNGDQADFYDTEIGAARFYGHLFDSFDSVGKQKAYAQLILANIARQVTLEWPWLTATQAISGPKIEQMRCSSRDCLDALRILKDEQILDHKIDGGDPKYRIRIPLVAESIRYDADEIEYQAADMLS